MRSEVVGALVLILVALSCVHPRESVPSGPPSLFASASSLAGDYIPCVLPSGSSPCPADGPEQFALATSQALPTEGTVGPRRVLKPPNG